jgi:alpha-ribazole phosphatase
MRLYLIRHPRPDIGAGICYGRSDIGLAQDPAASAEALRACLPAGLPVFSSPLRRCLELAQALHAAPVIDSRLAEMNFGRWEMQRWDDIPRDEIDAWAADPVTYPPPGGDSPAQVRVRVAAWLAERPAAAVVVSHGGVLRACVGELTGATDWHTLKFDFGAVSLVEDGRLSWLNRLT